MTPNILEVLKWQPKLFEFVWFDLGEMTAARRNFMVDEVNRQKDSGELYLPMYTYQLPQDLPMPFDMFGIVMRESQTHPGLIIAVTFDRKGNDLQLVFRHPTGKVLEMTQIGEKSALRDGTPDMRYNGDLLEALKKAPTNKGKNESEIVHMHVENARELYWLLMLEVLARQKAVPAYRPISHPSNDKRIRKGKKPLFEWKVIDVTAKHAMPENSAPTGRTHASPRRHVRRGHQRTLADGRRIWIKQMMVGKIEFGYIHHSYTTKGAMI
jgi:hypothetical protein